MLLPFRSAALLLLLFGAVDVDAKSNVAVITGGGSGIGRALALDLASEEDTVVFIVGRKLAALEETAALATSGSIITCEADLSFASGRAAVGACVADVETIDQLVHNAAVLPIGPLADVAEDEWRLALGVNLEAPIFLTQLLRPKLTAAGGARVLLVGSAAAEAFYPSLGLYGITKNALKFVHSGLKEELRAHGISLGYVNPGMVATRMQDTLASEDGGFAFKDIVQKRFNEATPNYHTPKELGIYFNWLLRREGIGEPAGISEDAFTTTLWDIDRREQHSFDFTETDESRIIDAQKEKVEL